MPVWEEVNNYESNGSFEDIISEQLAHKIDQRENFFSGNYNEDILFEKEAAETDSDVANDELLALLLQAEFDADNDSHVLREQRHLNQKSKVSIDFSNFLLRTDSISTEQYDKSLSAEQYDTDLHHNDIFDVYKFPSCGYIVDPETNNLITKHNPDINSQNITRKMMLLPPNIHTGDGSNLKINEKVLNVLKNYSRSARNSNKQRHIAHNQCSAVATVTSGLNREERLSVFKLINAGVVDKLTGVVSSGKEAIVVHADTQLDLIDGCAIKLFRRKQNNYKTKSFDHTVKGKSYKKRNKLFSSAEFEYTNLLHMRKAGIMCPEPVCCKGTLLVMSFIGSAGVPALKLKNCQLNTFTWKRVYNQIIHICRCMYWECNLVHADFSVYNILYYNDSCYVIDVSQSISSKDPEALTILRRDLGGVLKFLSDKLPAHELDTLDDIVEKVVAVTPCSLVRCTDITEDTNNGDT